MALSNSNNAKLIQFYTQCLEKSYLDMSDATQSLKAKVIAMDLNLKYKSIDELFNTAKAVYEKDLEETERAKKAAEAEEARRAVSGTLLFSAADNSSSIKVYQRPDKSCYCELDYGKDYEKSNNNSAHDRYMKVEGTPSINAENSGVVLSSYHPSKTVFTGASSGGIIMGGTHQTKAYTENKHRETTNGELIFSHGDFAMEAFTVRVSNEVSERFKRDPQFNEYFNAGCASLFDISLFKSQAQAILNYGPSDYASQSTQLSVAADSVRSPMKTVKAVQSILIRALKGDYPPTDEEIYNTAIVKMENGQHSADYKAAADSFALIADYKDAAEKEKASLSKYEEVLQQEKEAKILRMEAKAAENAKKRKKTLAIGLPIIILVIAFIIVLVTIILPKQKYNTAMNLIDNGKYDEAYAILLELGDNDAIINNKNDRAAALLDKGDYDAAYELLEEIGNTEMIASNKYDRAAASIESGDYASAYTLLNGLNYKNSADLLDSFKFQYESILLKNAAVGSHIIFGSYEQDNIPSNGKEDIEWLVLARENGRLLIISRYVLEWKPYSTGYYGFWGESTLNHWLNDSFMKAFTSDEKARIPVITVTDDNNSANDTQGKVFLLSVKEAEKYFSSDNGRRCEPTAYAIAKGCEISDTGHCAWWLRGLGKRYLTHAAYVVDHGGINDYGQDVIEGISFGVRPALWVMIDTAPSN